MFRISLIAVWFLALRITFSARSFNGSASLLWYAAVTTFSIVSELAFKITFTFSYFDIFKYSTSFFKLSTISFKNSFSSLTADNYCLSVLKVGLGFV